MSTKSSAWQAGKKKKIKNKKSYANIAHKSKVLIFTRITHGKSSSDAAILGWYMGSSQQILKCAELLEFPQNCTTASQWIFYKAMPGIEMRLHQCTSK